ncbi:hypothetical protein [Chelatococcus reniformis]|nr:hypothetical protein [Chelatococcus reniformis]
MFRSSKVTLPTLALLACLAPGAAGAAERSRPAQVLLEQISCAVPPAPASVLYFFRDIGLISNKPTRVADSLNYFKLKKPLDLDGVQAVAVFGFDETGTFPFVRAPGTSPGQVIGFVAKTSKPKIIEWADNGHGGKAIQIEDQSDFGPGYIEAYCNKLPPRD